MITDQERRTILTLTLVLSGLLVLVSCVGLFVPGTYASETPTWTAQAVGQDIFDLFIVVPFMLVSALFIYRKSRKAMLAWSGAILYLIYSFIIYCFAVHFNVLFVLYCSILGLSFYSFLYFLLSQIKQPISEWFNDRVPVKAVAVYLIVIVCIFYVLWLSEIVPSIIAGTTPKIITETGLLTNPVHALDLSIILPGFFIIALLLLKKKPLGLLLAPCVLVFMILMDITIGGLNIIMGIKGLDASYGITIIMMVLAVVSAILLVKYLKSARRNV